jgi:hypothetical protein
MDIISQKQIQLSLYFGTTDQPYHLHNLLAKVMQRLNTIMAESPGLITICLFGYLLSAECTGLFPFQKYIECACLSDIEMSGTVFFPK